MLVISGSNTFEMLVIIRNLFNPALRNSRGFLPNSMVYKVSDGLVPLRPLIVLNLKLNTFLAHKAVLKTFATHSIHRTF